MRLRAIGTLVCEREQEKGGEEEKKKGGKEEEEDKERKRRRWKKRKKTKWREGGRDTREIEQDRDRKTEG